MNINKIAVIFTIISASLLSIHSYKIKEIEYDKYLSIYYNRILENASDDASFKLLNSKKIYSDKIAIDSDINPNEVFESFFKSLALSLGKYSEEDIEELKKYFPLLCVIENDGIVLNSFRNISQGGNSYSKRITMPKMNFYFVDDNIIYYPSLNGELTVIYKYKGKFIEESGYPEKLLKRPNRSVELKFLKQANIEKILKEKIFKQISKLISYEIERHENEMQKSGFKYDFYLPKEYEELDSYISSSSFMAIMQGYPINKKKHCNINNISKIGLTKSKFYLGFIENGIKYYSDDKNPEIQNKNFIEAFSNEESALKSGYFKWEWINYDVHNKVK